MSVPQDNAAGVGRPLRLRPHADIGRGYSRFVGLAKRVLPGLAISLLVVVAVWPHIQAEIEHVHFSGPRIDPREAQDLRMVNARYTGIDRANRPFVVTADVARQNPHLDDLVALEGPKGDLTTSSGSWFEVDAYTGLYQPDAQILDLFGKVDLFQDKGNEFHTDSAHVDMGKGDADGNDPVDGQGPFGRITGQGFRIRDHGDVIVFTGHTHLLLSPHEKEVQ